MMHQRYKNVLLHRRSGFDRRLVGTDRRQSYSLAYFENGGVERRQADRRHSCEMRHGWIRCDDGLSVVASPEQ